MPNQPAADKRILSLRVPREIHAAARQKAACLGVLLSAYVRSVLETSGRVLPIPQNDNRQSIDEMKTTTEPKNIQKGLAYKLAHKQMNEAIDGERPFPIEALAIEESILSDRLRSAIWTLVPKARGAKTFAQIIKTVFDQDVGTATPGFEDLHAALAKKGGLAALDAWRKQRNRFVHGLTCSLEPRKPTEIGSNVYLEEGLAAAREGRELVRIVEAWSKKCVRAAKRAAKKKA